MNSLATHAFDPSPLQRRRLAWCVAEGWSLEKAACAADFALSEAEELLDDADFVHLVEGFQRLGEQSKDDILDQLTEMAWLVLEEALCEGDPRVALFFLKEEFAGFRPAEVIAKAILGPRGEGTLKKPMTVFVPPRWHERPVLRPKQAGSAAKQRWSPPAKKLSTMQVVYLRMRTRNQRLGFGSPLPGGGPVRKIGKNANLHHGRQPHAP